MRCTIANTLRIEAGSIFQTIVGKLPENNFLKDIEESALLFEEPSEGPLVTF
jgi:hypothetical protein